jgi:hypothetical protein
MAKEKVLLRRVAADRWEEVGTVEKLSGKTVVLKLSDGTLVEHVRTQGEVPTPRGSLAHLARIHPAELSRHLSEHPDEVVKVLLHEAGKPLNAKAIKDKLRDLGVPDDLVDKAWTTARPSLEQDAAWHAPRNDHRRTGWRRPRSTPP